MNAWSGTTQTRLTQSTILLIGLDSRIQRSLTRELQALSASTRSAPSLEEASRLHGGKDRPPNMELLPEGDIEPTEFEEALGALRIRTGAPSLVPIAFGPAPSIERRRALRDAGVELALFGRFGRHALRFQVKPRAIALGETKAAWRTSCAQRMAVANVFVWQGKGGSLLQSFIGPSLFRDPATVGRRFGYLARITDRSRATPDRRPDPVYESRRRRTSAATRNGHPLQTSLRSYSAGHSC